MLELRSLIKDDKITLVAAMATEKMVDFTDDNVVY
jgi:hypothetical protein